MNLNEFQNLFKDLISHLYDYAVVETHPLLDMVDPPAGFSGSRGEYLRDFILEEIERFRPDGREESPHSIEWRSYQILKGRYVDGLSLQELSQLMSLSERQLRRDNSRALRALIGRVWQDIHNEGYEDGRTENGTTTAAFEVNLEKLDMGGLLSGVTAILDKRIRAEGFHLLLETPPEPIFVTADRIILRQILIGLISHFLNIPGEKDEIFLVVENELSRVILRLWTNLVDPWAQEDEQELAELMAATRHWCGQVNAGLGASHPPIGKLGKLELVFEIHAAEQPIILVVDDQKPTHQMFRRFLSKTRYQIVGVTDSSEALRYARQLQPQLITLDVMMPKVDGWEVLQAIKADTATNRIPILVCSAWEEPELAESLGADGFIKKPVTQQDLLAALERLNL